MISNHAIYGVAATGMPGTSHALIEAHPAIPAAAAPRKRRAAAGTVAASVRGST